jgi:hypothetical protein
MLAQPLDMRQDSKASKKCHPLRALTAQGEVYRYDFLIYLGIKEKDCRKCIQSKLVRPKARGEGSSSISNLLGLKMGLELLNLVSKLGQVFSARRQWCLPVIASSAQARAKGIGG